MKPSSDNARDDIRTQEDAVHAIERVGDGAELTSSDLDAIVSGAQVAPGSGQRMAASCYLLKFEGIAGESSCR